MLLSPVVLNVLGFKINSLDHLSNFVMGANQQTDLYLSNKRNQGFGEDNGDFNSINFPVNSTADMDFLDANSQKTSFI